MNRQEFTSAYNKISLSEEFKAQAKAKLREQINAPQNISEEDWTDEHCTAESVKLTPTERKDHTRRNILAGLGAAAAVGLGVWGGVHLFGGNALLPNQQNETAEVPPIVSEEIQETAESSEVEYDFDLAQHSVIFPAYYDNVKDYNTSVFSALPFEMKISLPEDWHIQQTEYPTGFSLVEIQDGDGNIIGSADFMTYEIYPDMTHEHENYYRMVYNQYMMGNVITWDRDFTIVKQQDGTCAATCHISHEDTVAGAGILAHSDELLSYVAISFEDVLDPQLHTAIAKSVSLSASTEGLSARIADQYLDTYGGQTVSVTSIPTRNGRIIAAASGELQDHSFSLYAAENGRLTVIPHLLGDEGRVYRGEGYLIAEVEDIDIVNSQQTTVTNSYLRIENGESRYIGGVVRIEENGKMTNTFKLLSDDINGVEMCGYKEYLEHKISFTRGCTKLGEYVFDRFQKHGQNKDKLTELITAAIEEEHLPKNTLTAESISADLAEVYAAGPGDYDGEMTAYSLPLEKGRLIIAAEKINNDRYISIHIIYQGQGVCRLLYSDIASEFKVMESRGNYLLWTTEEYPTYRNDRIYSFSENDLSLNFMTIFEIYTDENGEVTYILSEPDENNNVTETIYNRTIKRFNEWLCIHRLTFSADRELIPINGDTEELKELFLTALANSPEYSVAERITNDILYRTRDESGSLKPVSAPLNYSFTHQEGGDILLLTTDKKGLAYCITEDNITLLGEYDDAVSIDYYVTDKADVNTNRRQMIRVTGRMPDSRNYFFEDYYYNHFEDGTEYYGRIEYKVDDVTSEVYDCVSVNVIANGYNNPVDDINDIRSVILNEGIYSCGTEHSSAEGQLYDDLLTQILDSAMMSDVPSTEAPHVSIIDKGESYGLVKMSYSWKDEDDEFAHDRWTEKTLISILPEYPRRVAELGRIVHPENGEPVAVRLTDGVSTAEGSFSSDGGIILPASDFPLCIITVKYEQGYVDYAMRIAATDSEELSSPPQLVAYSGDSNIDLCPVNTSWKEGITTVSNFVWQYGKYTISTLRNEYGTLNAQQLERDGLRIDLRSGVLTEAYIRLSNAKWLPLESTKDGYITIPEGLGSGILCVNVRFTDGVILAVAAVEGEDLDHENAEVVVPAEVTVTNHTTDGRFPVWFGSYEWNTPSFGSYENTEYTPEDYFAGHLSCAPAALFPNGVVELDIKLDGKLSEVYILTEDGSTQPVQHSDSSFTLADRPIGTLYVLIVDYPQGRCSYLTGIDADMELYE